ncbi:MAG TPA: type I-C CRISPR-associated protein Cas8c/Csd1 [Lachnospiraceae bacterium]|nr:type I-C CRISPR-associated protein Cas8c/Csd1 [Lachnospiraceae bacterium]
MILHALVDYYEDLRAAGKIPGPGWGKAKINYALYIDDNGDILQAASVMDVADGGKKKIPRIMDVPAPVKRAVDIKSNFLWDNSSYILGVDSKGKPERAEKCFHECKELHLKILEQVNTPASQAAVRFFENWDPLKAEQHPALKENWEDLISGSNFILCYNRQYLTEDTAIRNAWEEYYLASGDGPEMPCLITGKYGKVEKIHPSIKGIRNAQSSGAALISFNAPAFCSYGKEQNYNAPVSQYAAFAYTSALNDLIADREHVSYVGDTAVLCWAKGNDPVYQNALGLTLFGAPSQYSQQDITDMMHRLVAGNIVDFEQSSLDPARPFYVLGIAPNAARLSVRFFLESTFGDIIRNVMDHHNRMEIIRSVKDPFPTLPLWKMLAETVNQKANNKTPSPVMSGEVLRAILMNARYPATLLNAVNLRIRAEHEISRGRAAIIKAYYLKNRNKDVPEEVLTVALNVDSQNVPYNLGRLFSLLENIQSTANPGINSTIRDKYFNSASATPGTVFPVLINLSQKHLKKIGGGLEVKLNRDLTGVMSKLPEEFPSRMNLAQQGSFQLGYYHQTQARYQGGKKEE